jgi:hypothetical protein
MPCQATDLEAIAPANSRAATIREEMIDTSRRATDSPTFVKGLVSLTAAVGIALLVPFIMLLIGLPIVLAVRGVVAALSWVVATFMS